jgi:8-oxo-dGTP pyrophosphatase MutT (NUDIX family)
MDTTLHAGKFVQLKQRDGDGYSYEFVHESRCDGNIVAILPVSFSRGMLVRHEFTPCWGDGLNVSSITGGWEKDRHPTPIDTVLEELREEAGIVLNDESCIMSLGTCRGTKSSDTLYHLFVVDLTEEDMWDQIEIETDGSVLEGKAHNEWVTVPAPMSDTNAEDCPWLVDGQDPLLYVMFTRWMTGLLHKDVSRADYA